MVCHRTQRHKIISDFLAPYFAASTSLPLPCKLDGQPPKGQWTLADTSSETSSPRTDHALLYHYLHTGSFLTAPELFSLTDPQQELTCCARPGETRPSGRACRRETRGLHTAVSKPHPAQENIATVSSKGREGAVPAMKSKGQHTEWRPTYLGDTVSFTA